MQLASEQQKSRGVKGDHIQGDRLAWWLLSLPVCSLHYGLLYERFPRDGRTVIYSPSVGRLVPFYSIVIAMGSLLILFPCPCLPQVVRAFHRFTLVDQNPRDGEPPRHLTKGRRRDQGAVKISCARQVCSLAASPSAERRGQEQKGKENRI